MSERQRNTDTIGHGTAAGGVGGGVRFAAGAERHAVPPPRSARAKPVLDGEAAHPRELALVGGGVHHRIARFRDRAERGPNPANRAEISVPEDIREIAPSAAERPRDYMLDSMLRGGRFIGQPPGTFGPRPYQCSRDQA